MEGSDLTVRGTRVYLKSMHGLQRVHGILRRLDDDFCDPVELRSESTIGVPGLIEAIRARQVLVARLRHWIIPMRALESGLIWWNRL